MDLEDDSTGLETVGRLYPTSTYPLLPLSSLVKEVEGGGMVQEEGTPPVQHPSSLPTRSNLIVKGPDPIPDG